MSPERRLPAGRSAGILAFRSPSRAQLWFEWRRHGMSLPALVAILMPFELALLFVFKETPVIIFETLLLALITPPFMAVFLAATVSEAHDSRGLTPFQATRPMTSASLIAAKLKVTILSTIAAWILVAIAIPIAVRLSGTAPTVIGWMHDTIDAIGRPRAIALVLLAFAGLVVSTWKQLVQSLYIGLSGRKWAVKASVFITLSLLAVFIPVAQWAVTHGVLGMLWNAMPWLFAVLVCLKLAAAAWITIRLHHTRLVSDRMLLIGAIGWDVAVFALYGLLVWFFPMDLIRTWLLALFAILEIPLARLSAAPLALAWNRHR